MNKYTVRAIENIEGQWYWRILRSGKTLTSSEIYGNKRKAIKAAKIVASGLGVIAEIHPFDGADVGSSGQNL